MKIHTALILSGLVLAGCNVSADGNSQKPAEANGSAAGPVEDPFRFEDVADDTQRQVNPTLQAQVILARLGFSPGVIDGKEGQSFKLALKGFQQSRDLTQSGELDEATRAAMAEWRDVTDIRTVRIPRGFAAGPFQPNLPKDLNDQAKLPAIGYRDLSEKLAERFHTTPETLAALNPGVTEWKAGSTIRVPNIPDVPFKAIEGDERGWAGTLAMLGVATDQPQADHIRVSKSEGVLRVFDAQDKLIAQFPATMGSHRDPLPIGTWTIKGVSRNPDFHYNPDLFWDASSKDEKAVLKPGPNGPVGVVWIDISKPHYGIHGTPEPQTIGRTESHGCVRLTNWDAARLAQMVKPGVSAVFEE